MTTLLVVPFIIRSTFVWINYLNINIHSTVPQQTVTTPLTASEQERDEKKLYWRSKDDFEIVETGWNAEREIWLIRSEKLFTKLFMSHEFYIIWWIFLTSISIDLSFWILFSFSFRKNLEILWNFDVNAKLVR